MPLQESPAEPKPGLVQKTPPPVKPKPRTLKTVEKKVCCIVIHYLSSANWASSIYPIAVCAYQAVDAQLVGIKVLNT